MKKQSGLRTTVNILLGIPIAIGITLILILLVYFVSSIALEILDFGSSEKLSLVTAYTVTIASLLSAIVGLFVFLRIIVKNIKRYKSN